ncbi:UDP-glucuronosyltransferase 2B31-like [Strongylocentrotus purpuratus]|uniref:UDP-glucuronosyltransferase n=1 Tax=Strongylocentrotus purpuratus TaxID=7668 RepID=A0A7M7P989_STRPU|nr:UDP-glucuronosyltransferase 2B31-like [Strongylocentrotus purpuratus]
MFSWRVRHILVAVGLLLALSDVESANILLFGVFGDGSHYFTMVAVGKSLVKRGHNVTFLISDEYSDRATDPEHATIVSYEMFHLSGLKKRMDYISNKTAEVTFVENSMKHMAEMMDMFTSVNREACESVFEDQRMLDRMAKFDAFVVDVVWSCVGGLTTRLAEALDNELENFMQSSGKHGVVLFSLGTYFASITKSRPDIIRMFIDAFSRLPHKVLLHLKKPPPYKIPDNIKPMKWLPLNDLLGHPKTRAVLYHRENNGFLEALYHGVPLVVMPLGADQHDVAARVLANGLGTKIDKDRLSADYIYQQLNEVPENTSYSTNAKRLSAIFRDRPMPPATTAAFWIEHVIKHGGGHLRPPTHSLAFFQIYLLDIAAFGILLVGILFFIMIKRTMRWCCCRKKIVKTKRD